MNFCSESSSSMWVSLRSPEGHIANDIRNSHLSWSQDFSQELKNLSIEYPANPTIACLNINSIRNKFNDLQELVKGNTDGVMTAETRTDAYFTTSQFLLEKYHQSFRLDINSKSGSTLVFVKSSVPWRKLKCDILSKSTDC